jgi:hypothetical protein
MIQATELNPLRGRRWKNPGFTVLIIWAAIQEGAVSPIHPSV